MNQYRSVYDLTVFISIGQLNIRDKEPMDTHSCFRNGTHLDKFDENIQLKLSTGE